MKKITTGIFILIIASVFTSFRNTDRPVITGSSPVSYHSFIGDTILYPEEKHFKNIQQLTFAGDNAEAYWSFDGKYLVFQHRNPAEGFQCDQIFYGKVPQKPGEK
ncbi:MAG TPA: hypothetical protein VET23_10015, partial [Chitinophagaceae bacterium]|nr:hypothetical protein [Chitinophagaceae bacterium]